MNTLYQLSSPLRAVIKRIGPQSMKQLVWDAEARRGGNIHAVGASYRSAICDLIEKYSAGGHILDLGCSDGHVAVGLNDRAFASYSGVDISEVAIGQALKKRAAMTSARAGKIHFHVGEIGNFTPASRLNVVLFKDSLYYLTRRAINDALAHYQQWLEPAGVFVVQMDNIERHGWIRDLIRQKFTVIEDIESVEQDWMAFVFRGRTV
jgi:SAM-dependent methyltransferase